MGKKKSLDEMRRLDEKYMRLHKEMQEQIKKAEAAEREHIASEIVQACLDSWNNMPADTRPPLESLPGLIRQMWSSYFSVEEKFISKGYDNDLTLS